MANEFLTQRAEIATVTLVNPSPTESSVTIPAGSIVTGIVVKNNALLVGAGNFQVTVDTVAQMAAAAATLTSGNVSRFTPNSAVVTTESGNGGKIGMVASGNTTGSVDIIVTYVKA